MRTRTLPFMTAVLLLVCCVQQRDMPLTYPQKDPTKEERTAHIARYRQGHVLYDLKCAECHTVLKDSIPMVPDFTQEQLTHYELRRRSPHFKAMGPKKLTQEELVTIQLYLLHKAPSGVPFLAPVSKGRGR